jgi:hypothetical protein
MLLLLASCADAPLDPAAAPATRALFSRHPGGVNFLVDAFDAVARVSAGGREVGLSGPIQCEPNGARAQFRVVLTQDATGAQGTGHFAVTCTEAVETWTTTVHAEGRSRFAPGSALACAALTPAFGLEAGQVRWCRTVILQ